MNAYRCDKCGQFRDLKSGSPTVVEWRGGRRNPGIVMNPVIDRIIDLCPDCAREVIAPLEAIAKTEVKP